MTTFGYYPGCALHGASNDYETSLRACLGRLGASLEELDDWICCGASAAHSVNALLSVALPARNLGVAERDGRTEVLCPCPMCSMELIRAKQHLSEDEKLRRRISEIVELDVTGKTEILNLIQVFQKIGTERIKAAAKISLEWVNAACYYGCLLTRPPKEQRFDDCEQPRSMETLLEVLGAKTVAWNFKTECCGAGMTMAQEETVLELSDKIIGNASVHGANCIVVACPMCHVNLDMKQGDIERRRKVRHGMVIYYLSDLVGLALGLSEKDLAIDKHFVARR